jgi:uncharacterized protein
MGIAKSTHKKTLTKAKILGVLGTHRREILEFGVKTIGLFGSLAKGKGKSSSDIDILVEFRNPTFDQYMDLKFFLEDLFGKKVDLVLRDTLKPRIRKYILDEVVYAQGF